MRHTLSRALLIAVTLVVVAIYYTPIGHVNFIEGWGEGTFGATSYSRTNVLGQIDHGSPADRAGIRAGDRVVDDGDVRVSSLLRAPYAGEVERFRFRHGGQVYSVTLKA
ncbi:MAG TPA: hypothetical protein VGF18_04935, partial [Candidatus Tumulicola sp.]